MILNPWKKCRELQEKCDILVAEILWLRKENYSLTYKTRSQFKKGNQEWKKSKRFLKS